ncbi:MAG: AAA family ATPase [Prevotella sp.]|nr:AAA family ATPase [Prevotella sp.]
MRSGGQRIEQLSEGYKIVIAMVADLVARMAEANPGMDNPLEASGIVLVDEIDLHLHPQWQREIILQLTTVFKNIQFIVTTHSPIIVMGAANVAQVVNLNMTDNETEDVSKSNIGAILLSELFGLPSLDLCNELQEKMKAPSTPYSGMLTNLE